MPDPFDHNFESSTGQIALDRAPRVHLEYSVFKGKATVKEQIRCGEAATRPRLPASGSFVRSTTQTSTKK
jgi:hypothetical protein